MTVTSGCYQQYHPLTLYSAHTRSPAYSAIKWAQGGDFGLKWLENHLFESSPFKYISHVSTEATGDRKKRVKKALENIYPEMINTDDNSLSSRSCYMGANFLIELSTIPSHACETTARCRILKIQTRTLMEGLQSHTHTAHSLFGRHRHPAAFV